jgi:DeoR family transcriptional regulator of aga operon/DeoR family fructose operon transcriptional repressor
MGSKAKPSESDFGSQPRPTYAPERRDAILQVLAEDGSVSVARLAGRLNVSEVTVRKDLAWLEERHQLVRTHGGAMAAGRRSSELAFEVRQGLNRAEKEAIGAAAAAMVHDGESICLDASTTALEVARNLRGRTELTIVTNGLRIAAELAGLPGITVLMPGGRVRWEAFSLVGTWGEALFHRVNIQRAFLGAVGFTLEESLTDVTDEEAQAKRAMVGAAREVIALIDHTKWGRVAFATFCGLDSISRVITDTRAPRDMVDPVRERGIRVDMVRP